MRLHYAGIFGYGVMTKKEHNHIKSRVRIYLEYLPLKLLYHIIRLLPLKFAYCFARFIGRVLYHVDRVHRNRTIEHILHANLVPDAAAARELGEKVFENFAMLLIEIFKADQALSPEKVRLVGDQETIRRCFSPDGPRDNFILITAHYGNWEMAGGAIGLLSGHTLVSLMRPFSNPLIGEMILKNRRTPVHELIDKTGGIRGVMKALRAHKNIALLIDQHAGAGEGVETLFFGQPARTHSSPALLHLKTGIPIMPQLTRRVAGDNFEFEVEVGPLIEYQATGDPEHDVQDLTQRCTAALEKMIRKAPEQWLWAHRRWLNINRHHYIPEKELKTSK